MVRHFTFIGQQDIKSSWNYSSKMVWLQELKPREEVEPKASGACEAHALPP